MGTQYIIEMCKERGISVKALERALGFSNGYINPKRLKKVPYDKAVAISKYLGCDLNRIMGEEVATEYYLDDDAKEYAKFLHANPDYKILFDASRKVSKDDLELAAAVLERFKKAE